MQLLERAKWKHAVFLATGWLHSIPSWFHVSYLDKLGASLTTLLCLTNRYQKYRSYQLDAACFFNCCIQVQMNQPYFLHQSGLTSANHLRDIKTFVQLNQFRPSPMSSHLPRAWLTHQWHQKTHIILIPPLSCLTSPRLTPLPTTTSPVLHHLLCFMSPKERVLYFVVPGTAILTP